MRLFFQKIIAKVLDLRNKYLLGQGLRQVVRPAQIAQADQKSFTIKSPQIKSYAADLAPITKLQKQIFATDTKTAKGQKVAAALQAQATNLQIKYLKKFLADNQYTVADFQAKGKTQGFHYLVNFVLKHTQPKERPIVGAFLGSTAARLLRG